MQLGPRRTLGVKNVGARIANARSGRRRRDCRHRVGARAKRALLRAAKRANLGEPAKNKANRPVDAVFTPIADEEAAEGGDVEKCGLLNVGERLKARGEFALAIFAAADCLAYLRFGLIVTSRRK